MISRPFCYSSEAEVDQTMTVAHVTENKVSLNEENSERVRDQFLALADEPSQTRLLLDFHNVHYASGVALGILIAFTKKVLAAGRCLSLCDRIPPIYETLAVAAATLRHVGS
jgi:anti-anti-sigma regulatory factor